jgi:serine/threonine-protein kinase
MSIPQSSPRAASGFPSKVGPYELLLPIAAGGMGTVFLARRHGAGGFRRDVALKLLHPHLRLEQKLIVDLLEEARLAALLKHPNVVPVLDAGDEPEATYLVMEYVDGDTLGGLLKRAADDGYELSLGVITRVMCDVLDGLEAAHELRGENGRRIGLVHRDVSPQNVLVGTDGVARLSDFGIARATTRLSLTQTGIVKGKVGYMSPEQARGRELDRRSDVWAAGVIAWELFAGKRLIDESDPLFAAARLFERDPALLRSVRPDLPQAVEEAVASALSVDLERRCPTAREFAKRLAEAVTPASREELSEVVGMLTEVVREERSQAIEHRAPFSEPPPALEIPKEQTSGLHVTSYATRKRRLWAAAGVTLVALSGLAFALSQLGDEAETGVSSSEPSREVMPSAPLPEDELDAEPEEELHAGTAVIPVGAEPVQAPEPVSAKPTAARPPAPKSVRRTTRSSKEDPRKPAPAPTPATAKPKEPEPLKLQPNPY